jgi:BirA family biotin operon repressor/biotin-[acetyl-CoA-carboxylase] ligase
MVVNTYTNRIFVCKFSILSHNSTFSFNTSIVQLDEVVSTNDLAKQLIEKDEAQHGTLIRANFQRKGRGQELNGWESQKGENILCSWILKPDISVDKQVYLNIAMCLALHDFTNAQLPNEQVCIKWPNDIYVNHSKMAGLLIENGIQGNAIKHTIIGIGLNINQLYFTTPKACSLSQFTKQHYNIEVCTQLLRNCLSNRYQQLIKNDTEQLWLQYHAVLYKKNIPSQFEYQGSNMMATPIGIDDAGRLKMMVNGDLQLFNVKELKWS